MKFTLSNRIENIENVVGNLGFLIAKGVPGYIVPQDLEAKVYLYAPFDVIKINTDTPSVFRIRKLSQTEYAFLQKVGAFRQVRLNVEYDEGRKQSIHYLISHPGSTAIQKVGQFLNDRHWWKNKNDPFGRAPWVD